MSTDQTPGLSMTTSNKVERIGELIRLLRRQKNLTQTDLGANRYSKSYVSAVEKNAIHPSTAALRFFAEQLDQHSDYFTAMLENGKSAEQGRALFGPLEVGSYFLHDDSFSLLSLLMQHPDPLSLQNLQGIPLLTTEILAGFPPSRQSYYFLLSGLIALASQKYETALQTLEQALPLATPQLRPQVLDALGQYYALTGLPVIALHFHLRAIEALTQVNAEGDLNSMLFVIALHCAENYQALADYEGACTMYEQARKHLRPEHMMENAARIYLGLGYSTYALAFQDSQTQEAAQKALAGEMEQGFQQATSYILQSRSIYQVINDREGEAATGLMQTMTLLDFITRYWQLVAAMDAQSASTAETFLNTAQELCREILIRWNDMHLQGESIDQQDSIIYAALGRLLKINIQRAILMRLRRQFTNALRERISAASLCQLILNTLAEPNLSSTVVQQIMAKQSAQSMPESPALPHLPELQLDTSKFNPRFSGLIEIYSAAGEVAEELGRTATTTSFRQDCYFQADQCFHMVLALAKTIVSAFEYDPGYLLRHYQRYASLLEVRLIASPEVYHETSLTLATLVKDGFSHNSVMNI
jgi:tetratricopeptide (TPR) repeat protein